MPQITSLFVTPLYRAALSEQGKAINVAELETSCLSIAEDDEAGQNWCDENGYPGYTSYASLANLAWAFPIFKDLVNVWLVNPSLWPADPLPCPAVDRPRWLW